ncbi:MAG: HD domain-containing protein [Chloroflexota bacterium]
MLLDYYRPAVEWFSHDPYSIHGFGHVARVLLWADAIARSRLAAGEDLDLEAVRWAAALHDLGRHHDSYDIRHGERSALWLEDNSAQLPAPLTAKRLATVAYCCRWHVPADRFAPAMTAELRCLKDADGLDRVRVYDLDPEQLRTPEGRTLVTAAWDLYRATDPLDKVDPWSQVRRAARERGFWG